MFDDLRKEASSVYESEPTPTPSKATALKTARKPKKILGMTAVQRFVVTFMLMLMVFVIGFMFLLITGRIGF